MKNRSVKQLRQLGYDRFADEIEQLMARVAELEEQLEAEEMQSDMFVRKYDTLKQRLRDVMIEACNRPLDVTVAIARAAGHVRCECGGSGWYVGATVADEYHNPMQEQIECPCVANGTTGWREANDE